MVKWGHKEDRRMNEDAWAQLKLQVAAKTDSDKVTLEKRLKDEILQMRSLASLVEAKPGYFVCEGDHGRGVADKKEATHFHALSHKPIRWVPFKSHLYAVHAVLCWVVLGISTDHW
jgi:tripartite-type tricarboxylate transporter receptor subunit TctC